MPTDGVRQPLQPLYLALRITFAKLLNGLVVLLLAIAIIFKPVSAATVEEWRTRTIYRLFIDRFGKEDDDINICLNLNDYCGGTFKGVIKRLDYIANMGFDAILINPVVQQYGRGYHGYWSQNLYEINPEFGGEEGFQALIDEVHRRDMFLMVDVVINHTGASNQTKEAPTGNITEHVPFGDPKYYHPFCMIDYTNQTSVEQCRLGNSEEESLPDLNTEDTFVAQTLINFIANFTSFWGIDGYRIDAAKHIRKNFYPTFVEAAGVFMSGEVYYFYDDEYQASYVIDAGLPAVENYNLWKYIQSVFTKQNPPQTFTTLDDLIHNQSSVYPNTNHLTTFIENMDIGRFLQTDIFGGTSDPGLTQDQAKYKNALTLLLTMPGIPMVYYGAEQGLYSRAGDVDSFRMELWYSLYDTTTDLYGWITQLVSLRRMYAGKLFDANLTTLFVEDDVYAYTRGLVLTVLSSEGYASQPRSIVIPNLPYAPGTVLARLDDWTATVVVPAAGGGLNVTINNGRPLVFFPLADLVR
ncbi:hypothetical protein HK405_010023 [Cladochytrium tenue]|nr:hypothetical protein HK405_010023 [Cladochytrium tenue]